MLKRFLLLKLMERQRRRRLRLLFILVTILRYRESVRTRNVVSSDSLVQSTDCFWTQLWREGGDSEFIAAVGITKASMMHLHRYFKEEYTVRSGNVRL